MRKNFLTWFFAVLAGMVLMAILNTSPLARTGWTIQLPQGWQSIYVGSYSDKSCASRKAEGIPFAFKRPHYVQSCAFDVNRLGLFLNCAVGTLLGFSLIFMSREKKRPGDSSKKRTDHDIKR